LIAQAQARGKEVETFEREAVPARHKRSFAEILEPIDAAVSDGGMSEAEVGALLDRELKAARAKRS
jgi:hypothetical protein